MNKRGGTQLKVIWISRHKPGDVESTMLSDILGEVEIIPITGTVPNTWALRALLDDYSPDVVVATLPIDMQEVLMVQLRQRDMRPLIRPLYRHRRVGGDPDSEFEWMFHGFEEILEVSIKSRPLKSKINKEPSNGNEKDS
jgi:hypothetical protein